MNMMTKFLIAAEQSSAPLSSLDGVGVWMIFPQNNLPDFVADFAAVRYQIWLLLSPLLVKSEHLSVKTWQFNTRCELYHVDRCTVNQALSNIFKNKYDGFFHLYTLIDIQMWQRHIFRKHISISAAHTFLE